MGRKNNQDCGATYSLVYLAEEMFNCDFLDAPILFLTHARSRPPFLYTFRLSFRSSINFSDDLLNSRKLPDKRDGEDLENAEDGTGDDTPTNVAGIS